MTLKDVEDEYTQISKEVSDLEQEKRKVYLRLQRVKQEEKDKQKRLTEEQIEKKAQTLSKKWYREYQKILKLNRDYTQNDKTRYQLHYKSCEIDEKLTGLDERIDKEAELKAIRMLRWWRKEANCRCEIKRI